MTTVAVLNYPQSEVVIHKIDQDNMTPDTIEEYLSDKGYQMDEIHYMASMTEMKLSIDIEGEDDTIYGGEMDFLNGLEEPRGPVGE